MADNFQADAIFVLVTTDREKISEIFIQNTFKTKVFPVLLSGEMMERAKIRLLGKKIEFFEELDEAAASL